MAMARIAAGSGSVRVDVGWANEIAFLNVAGVGLETEVLKAVSEKNGVSGPLVYVAAALPLLRSFRAVLASIQVGDGPPGPMLPFCAIVASNGPRFGGGFKVAPGATVTDGKVDVVSVRDATPGRRLQLFVRVRLGTHIGQPEVERHTASKMIVRLDQEPLLDADGELHGIDSKQLSIRVDAGALRVGTR
jgi:diacylglycerol kinase family enzyme